MHYSEAICAYLDSRRLDWTTLSDAIWKTPELAYREFASCQCLIEFLEKDGFSIERDVAGIPTAFKASFGSGAPVIGLLGEYDALAGLSQQASSHVKQPVEAGGNGHGCGHNALGAGTAAAAVAIKNHLQQTNASGTIVFFGCPAEERGCGKSFMAKAGVFDEIDVALAWHPNDGNMILDVSCLANIQAEFSFEGKASHAASCPQLGRSALDAAELMNIGVQFLREHVSQDARIHYAFLDAGGQAPNVVQDTAKLLYYIRAPKKEQVQDIYARICNIAQGAALMTDTTASHKMESAMLDLIPNDVLGNLAAAAWSDVGPCAFSQQAKDISENFRSIIGLAEHEVLLPNNVPTYQGAGGLLYASTDVGDVSYVVPTLMLMLTSYTKNTPDHSWQLTAQTGSAIAHDGLVHSAKVLACIAAKIYEDPTHAAKAKAELGWRVPEGFKTLLADDITPDIPNV